MADPSLVAKEPRMWGPGDGPERTVGDLRLPVPEGHAQRESGYGSPPASAELKGARLSRGLSVEEVERTVAIRASYIRAIEAADVSELPGKPFDLGYVRSYARFLDTARYFGKDPEWYVEEYRRLLGAAGVDMPAIVVYPPPRPSGRRPRLWPVALALVLVVAFAVWHGFAQMQLLDLAAGPAHIGGAVAAAGG